MTHRGGAVLRTMSGLAAPALAIVALALAGCTASTGGQGSAQAAGSPAHTSTTTTPATGQSNSKPSRPAPSSKSKRKPQPKKPVHVSLQMSDGTEVGVGMPIIAYLSRPIADARAFAKATTVTVNGREVRGAWYFEPKSQLDGKPIEADYRLPNYWPAHARIHMALPVKGLSAGSDLAFDDSLTLDFETGPANIMTVDNSTHRATLTTDNKLYGKFPVSLGSNKTPTKRGVKVVMEKVPTVCMRDTRHTYNECGIKWDQRLTYSGEYLHAAPWNCTGAAGCTGPANNIGHANSSNGCTNLRPSDALRLYKFLRIGDVVNERNADGPLMRLGDGYGDWNVPWAQWLGGGLYRTS